MFCLPAWSPHFGMLFLFLSLLPLTLPSFQYGLKQGYPAFFSAIIMITVLLGTGNSLFFAIALALPALHFLRKCHLWRGEVENPHLYPVLAIMVELTCMMACFLSIAAIVTGHYETLELKSLMSNMLHEQLAQDPVFSQSPEKVRLLELIDKWNFLFIVIISWLWLALFYAMMVLSNHLLALQGKALRASLQLVPEGISLWLPVLFTLCAALSLWGTGNDGYMGETLTIVFLFPYLLCGCAVLNIRSRHWKNRTLWLGGLYVLMLLFLPWSILLMIGIGMYCYITQMG